MAVELSFSWRQLVWDRDHLDSSGTSVHSNKGSDSEYVDSNIHSASIPHGRWGAAAVLCKQSNCILLLGGCLQASIKSPQDDVWKLDLYTLRWKCLGSGANMQEASIDGSLALCSPFGGSGRAFHSAICIEAPIPTPLMNMDDDKSSSSGNVVDVITDLVFVFGGRTTGGSLTSSLHMINTKNMAWTSLTEIVKGTFPSAREGHSAVQIHSSGMVIYGGYNNQIWLHDLYFLDIDNLLWRRVELFDNDVNVKDNVLRTSTNEVHGFLIDVDGSGSVKNIRKCVSDEDDISTVFSSRKRRWTDFQQSKTNHSTYPSMTPLALSGHSMLVVDWRVMVLGGNNSDGIGNDNVVMQLWDTVTGTWEKITLPNTKRHQHSSITSHAIPSLHGACQMRLTGNQGAKTPKNGYGSAVVVFGGVYGGPWESPETRIYTSKVRAFLMGKSNDRIEEGEVNILEESTSSDASKGGKRTPCPRAGHCLVRITPSTAILIGGWDGVRVMQDTWILKLNDCTMSNHDAASDYGFARSPFAPSYGESNGSTWADVEGARGKQDVEENDISIENMHPDLLFGSERAGRLAEDRLRLDFVIAILSSLQSTISQHKSGISETQQSMSEKMAWLEQRRHELQEEVDSFSKTVDEYNIRQVKNVEELEQLKNQFRANDEYYLSLCKRVDVDNEKEDAYSTNLNVLLERVERLATS